MNAKSPIVRPAGVTLLGWGVLIIACVSLVRFIQAALQWDFLSSLPMVAPYYIALSGLGWGILAFALAWGIFKGKGWAPFCARLGVLVYAGYFWLDRWLVQQSSERWANWLFLLGMTVLLGGWIFWVLSRPLSRSYFGERHDG